MTYEHEECGIVKRRFDEGRDIDKGRYIDKGRDIDKGWAWVVLVAVYCAVLVISTSSFMGGILYVALLEEYGGDEAISSLIGSLNAGLLCLLGPFASIYMNSFSCRASIVTGGLLVSMACFTSAFITNVNWLILTYGVLGGIGYSFASTPLVVVLGYYFEKRRSTVISVSLAVIGFGMFLSSPFALSLLDTYGISGAFLILSGFNAHLCVFGAMCYPSSIEKRIHLQSSKPRHTDTQSIRRLERNPANKLQCWKITSRFNVEILKSPSFTVFMFSTLTWNLMLSVFLIHFPNYMFSQGASDIDITVLMTCFSVGNTAGRFLGAFIVYRQSINKFTVHVLALGIAGILTLVFPSFSYVTILKYGFAAISGILMGIPNALSTPILLRISSVELLSTARGLEYFFSGVGAILGPPVAGFLYSRTKTYQSSFYFAGIVVTVGAILGVVSSSLFQRANRIPDTTVLSELNVECNLKHAVQIETPTKEEVGPTHQPLLAGT